MSTRARLPNRRCHEVIAFKHGGFAYTAGVGRFDDGRPGEIFITCHKSGAIEAHARDAAIAISMALQHGAPIETIRHALGRTPDGQAAGPLGALLDIIAKESAAY